jgi:pilus assembly protein Flp/PilA
VIRRFFSDESGATALEYAVIAGLLSIVIMASIAPIGDKL